MKKEIDTILSLQGDLDTVEKAINTTKTTLATSATPEESKGILKGLLDMHTKFSDEVEALYVSLNIHDSYPDLKGASLEFVRTLLMAHDLKINIRKRAIGSFFEWDRLDQAVGGRNQALGRLSLIVTCSDTYSTIQGPSFINRHENPFPKERLHS